MIELKSCAHIVSDHSWMTPTLYDNIIRGARAHEGTTHIGADILELET